MKLLFLVLRCESDSEESKAEMERLITDEIKYYRHWTLEHAKVLDAPAT